MDSQPFPLASHYTIGPESRAVGEHRCAYPGGGAVPSSRVRDPRQACHSARDLSGDHVPCCQGGNEGLSHSISLTSLLAPFDSVFSP